jgi:S-formylglutathione hydrolase FrmB
LISRRAFLLGAGGALVLGGGSAGVVEYRDSIERKLGLQRSPDHHVPRANVPRRSGVLQSRYMKRAVRWRLSVPAGSLLGVVFCLHGRNNGPNYPFDTVRLDDVAAAEGIPLAFAAVDGGTDSYWHARADGTDAMAMLLKEFVPLIEQIVGRHPSALLGWSMGAYGALLVAERVPGRFRGVAAASPALWRSASASAPGAFDSADDYQRNDVFAGVRQLDGTMVRIDCGTGDPFYRAARHFGTLLGQPHVTSYRHGYHDAGYWRSVAPAQLHTIAQALSP